jgi:hypothetical protein
LLNLDLGLNSSANFLINRNRNIFFDFHSNRKRVRDLFVQFIDCVGIALHRNDQFVAILIIRNLAAFQDFVLNGTSPDLIPI